LALRPLITRLRNVCHRSGANTSFADGRFWTSDVPLARFDPSCCWTKIAPPIPMCNFPPFTFTHDSRVMSTICHYLCSLWLYLPYNSHVLTFLLATRQIPTPNSRPKPTNPKPTRKRREGQTAHYDCAKFALHSPCHSSNGRGGEGHPRDARRSSRRSKPTTATISSRGGHRPLLLVALPPHRLRSRRRDDNRRRSTVRGSYACDDDRGATPTT
jgi:hypothetical protein